MIGERIRQARLSRNRSLADVARKAKLSVASLSRIETNKQGVDTDLLVLLARVLGVPVLEILGETDDEEASLAESVASLSVPQRTRLWRDLAALQMDGDAENVRVPQEIEELVAHLDLLYDQLKRLRQRIRER